MCGIVLVKNNNDHKASKKVFKRYQAQSKRGTQGYGAVSIENGKIKQIYRSEDEAGIRAIYKDDATCMLFHHRTPTSTPNLEECTHPIFVSNEELDYDYLMVHNGVISNDTTLKSEFEKRGYEYTTKVQSYYKSKGEYKPNGREVFNDSESLAIDLAIAIDGNEPKLKALGSIAFVMIQYRKDTKDVTGIYFGRNDRNPLKLDRQGGNIVIASEGTGIDVEVHKLFKLDIETDEITSRPFDVGYNYKLPETTTKNAYNNNHRALAQGIYPANYFNTGKKETVPAMDIVKKKDLPLVKMTLHCVDICGVDHWVDVMTRGVTINRTAIDISMASLVTFEEWLEYEKFEKEITGYDTLSLHHKEYGLEFTPDDYATLSSEYKRLYMWMGSFSKKIKARAEQDGGKKLIDKLF